MWSQEKEDRCIGFWSYLHMLGKLTPRYTKVLEALIEVKQARQNQILQMGYNENRRIR